MSKNKKFQFHKISPEVCAAVVLGLLVLIVFGWQIAQTGQQASTLETSLFNGIQFLLTAGFAWFSTRAVSKAEFHAELRRFAIGAYRRVSDIHLMIQRLQNRTERMMVDAPDGDAARFAVVSAIVDDTKQALQSACADWGDIIGDELTAIKAIAELQTERSQLESCAGLRSTSPDVALRQLDAQISELRTQLPASLQFNLSKDNQADILRTAEWIANEHEEADGLVLYVLCGSGYQCDQDPTNFEPGKELFLVISGECTNIQDRNGAILGRVLNRCPSDYDTFKEALCVCYRSNKLQLSFQRIESTSAGRDDDLTKYKVKVLDTPHFPEPEDYTAPTTGLRGTRKKSRRAPHP